MMLFSEMSRWSILALASKDRCALIASRSAVSNSLTDRNSLIVRPAGEITKQLNMRFLYSSTCAFFLIGSSSCVSCFASYSSLSFDVWLLDLDLFAACGPLSMDFLFPNEDWEIPKLWNAPKDRESVTCDWDSENEAEALSVVFRNRCGGGNVKLSRISSMLVSLWIGYQNTFEGIKALDSSLIWILAYRRSCLYECGM